MTLDELPAWARELLASGRVGHLGLLDDDGRPRVLPVTYALHDGDLWSAVDWKPKASAEPARVRWLRADPRAALAVDEWHEDWSRLAWVQVLGEVDVVEQGDGRRALVEKYEQYSARPPEGLLLRLRPRRALCWRADA